MAIAFDPKTGAVGNSQTGGAVPFNPSAPTQTPAVTPASYEAQPAHQTAFGDQVNARADQTNKILNNATPAGKTNVLEKGAALFGQGVGVANDFTGDAIGAVAKPLLKTTNNITGGIAGALTDKAVQAAIKTPLGSLGVHALSAGPDAWSSFEAKYPRAAQDLSAIGPLANLITTFATAGEAKAAGEVVAPVVGDALKTGAQKTGTAIKDTAGALADKTKPAFQDVYKAHANGTKGLSNALDAGTITKGTSKITPIDTIEKYEATPKVIGNGKGGHVLDTKDVQEEATTASKAASKEVDAKAKAIATPYIKQDLVRDAVRAAGRDKDLTRTASVPAVKQQILKIFQDYGLKGNNINGAKINELRKGANSASQVYYAAQKAAATAGSIPKDVADRAQAFAILGDTFRAALVKGDKTIDDSLTTQHLHNAALQYAKKAHLSSVGLSGTKRALVDAGAAGAGAIAGGAVGQPIAGALAGGALSEKGQSLLLKRAYEGATKSSQSKF